MGVLQKTKQSMGIFFLVLLLYGQIWAFMPIDPKVSWQGHLSGLLTGILIAFWKGKLWLPPTQVNADPMNETAEDEDHQEPEDPYMEL
jgi:membrane associated rhomboid family serine protease